MSLSSIRDPAVLTDILDLSAISICGGDQSLIGPMARAMIAAATLGGAIYAATVDNGDVVGYAVWMPPGQELLTTSVTRCVPVLVNLRVDDTLDRSNGNWGGTSSSQSYLRREKTGSSRS